jgi:outer membrane protein assembly factor BamB
MPALPHALRPSRTLAVASLAALLLMLGCSKDKDVDKPAKLVPLRSPTLKVQRLWSSGFSDKQEAALRLGQGVSVENNRVYAADYHGEVHALDLQTGHLVWRARTRAPLSGGTAASAELVVVGASDGRLFALEAANGKLRWQVRLNGEVLAAPVISERLIAVRTVDGKLRALSPADGHELWTQEQQVPRLSLRGTARPLIVNDLVLCGFDNGKVIAVNANDGTVQWETTVTPPHGRTELERLADIDSQVSVSGHDVYAVGFQGRVAMLALDTGQIWWSHEASSYRGLVFDDDVLYVSDADGEVVALKARTGAELWRQTALLHRGLSSPAVMEYAIVVGDFQGYVHWLDKTNGALAARVSSGSTRISTAPVVVGNIVVVINDRGHINTYRVTAPAASSKRGTQSTQTTPRTPAAPATSASPSG